MKAIKTTLQQEVTNSSQYGECDEKYTNEKKTTTEQQQQQQKKYPKLIKDCRQNKHRKRYNTLKTTHLNFSSHFI